MSRHDWFELLLLLHVTGAVTALGPSLTYSLWRRRAETGPPQTRIFVLQTISWIDRRVATPSFGMQAVTGVGLILVLGISVLRTPWLLAGICLYGATAAFAGAVYVPVVRRVGALAELAASEPSEENARAYRDHAGRGRRLGSVAVAVTFAILFLMVVKPGG